MVPVCHEKRLISNSKDSSILVIAKGKCFPSLYMYIHVCAIMGTEGIECHSVIRFFG